MSGEKLEYPSSTMLKMKKNEDIQIIRSEHTLVIKNGKLQNEVGTDDIEFNMNAFGLTDEHIMTLKVVTFHGETNMYPISFSVDPIYQVKWDFRIFDELERTATLNEFIYDNHKEDFLRLRIKHENKYLKNIFKNFNRNINKLTEKLFCKV